MSWLWGVVKVSVYLQWLSKSRDWIVLHSLIRKNRFSCWSLWFGGDCCWFSGCASWYMTSVTEYAMISSQIRYTKILLTLYLVRYSAERIKDSKSYELYSFSISVFVLACYLVAVMSYKSINEAAKIRTSEVPHFTVSYSKHNERNGFQLLEWFREI